MKNSEEPLADAGATTLPMRIGAFVQLGKVFGLLGDNSPWPGHSCGLSANEYAEFDRVVREAHIHNAWFTDQEVRHAMRALSFMLDSAAVQNWVADHDAVPLDSPNEKRIGVITAGNMPLVGFHDLMCVLLSGHRARLRTSSQDADLLAAVVRVLERFAPGLAKHVEFAPERLGEVDALIATGSNNTARYFEHYFGHLPHVIRKNRVSVAVLDGTETVKELEALGEDVFRGFGLGCRSISKVFLPRSFDTDKLFNAFFGFSHVGQHHKYANNYEYHRALWLLEGGPFLDNGFLLLKENESLNSPVGALYYERYDAPAEVNARLQAESGNIQCVVGHGHVPFGRAQFPAIDDHADGVDTLAFLLGLHSTNS